MGDVRFVCGLFRGVVASGTCFACGVFLIWVALLGVRVSTHSRNVGGFRFRRHSFSAFGPWYPFTRGYGALYPRTGFLLVMYSFGVATATRCVPFSVCWFCMVSDK